MCNEDVEEQDDPLNEHRSAASETCLQSILPNYLLTWTIQTVIQQLEKFSTLHQVKVNTQYH